MVAPAATARDPELLQPGVPWPVVLLPPFLGLGVRVPLKGSFKGSLEGSIRVL